PSRPAMLPRARRTETVCTSDQWGGTFNVLTSNRYRRRGPRPRRASRPNLECLEARCLLSAYSLTQETLLGAADLGTLAVGGQVRAGAVIGAGPARAADVFWYEFHVPDLVTEHVRLSVLTREIGSPLVGAVSLFNDAPFDQFNP